MKIKQVQEFLKHQKCEGLLLSNSSRSRRDPTLFYFLQTEVENGLLWIPQQGKPVALIPGFEFERVKKEGKIDVLQGKKNIFQQLKKIIEGKKIAVNERFFSVYEKETLERVFRKVNITNAGELLAKLRLAKTEEELELLTVAAKRTDELFDELLNSLPSCRTEKEARNKLAVNAAERGYVFSFNPIIASGKNAAVPHHSPSDEKLKGFTIIDFGIKRKGYCSDMTRTVFFGKPSAEQKKIYQLLLDAQMFGIKSATEGVPVKKLEELARKKLGSYSKYFIHRIGHSLGIEVHDIVTEKPVVLKRNFVWTIEPGIYVPNKFGIRIEDDVVITKEGARTLTNAPKNLFLFPTQHL